MPALLTLGALLGLLVGLLTLYIWVNDSRVHQQPASLSSMCEKPFSHGDARKMAKDMARSNLHASKKEELKSQIPPQTGRRYIVVGGGGFLGGKIVMQLLGRGEDPKSIRVIDIQNVPANTGVAEACSLGLQYLKTNILDSTAIEDAFNAPWNDNNGSKVGITVFHSAANIRFFERLPIFLPRSTSVNVEGTRNIINASKHIGADVLVYTSSASVPVKSNQRLLWPWQTEPTRFVQVINDDDSLIPTTHSDYFSNYAITKRMAEILVRDADKTFTGSANLDGSERVLRTGALRPNGITGRGDLSVGDYVARGSNISWTKPIFQSFCYGESCALAHLLYERRLLDLATQDPSQKKRLPDIGGQAFCIADNGPVPLFNNIYTLLETLSDKKCNFTSVSPTLMLLIGYLIEAYHISQFFITSSFPALSVIFKPLGGDILKLQPSLFNLSAHILVDDSRARLTPEKGGLGYRPPWTTLESVYEIWEDFVAHGIPSK